jgi:hypothetical protein
MPLLAVEDWRRGHLCLCLCLCQRHHSLYALGTKERVAGQDQERRNMRVLAGMYQSTPVRCSS